MNTITPMQLFELVRSGKEIDLIDVRTPVEYREVHVTFAKNIPLDKLDASQLVSERRKLDRPLYVICRSGSRGKQACEKIHASGFTDVVNVEGGTSAWEQAGLPVIRGKKAISLERQVRIVVGSGVLMGSVLGYFVHPYWIGLAAFFGAGLLFAGITDFCGLGLFLARMPWNQVPASKPCNVDQAVIPSR